MPQGYERMESAHSKYIVKISENTEKCLINEHLVSASEIAACTMLYSFLLCTAWELLHDDLSFKQLRNAAAWQEGNEMEGKQEKRMKFPSLVDGKFPLS